MTTKVPGRMLKPERITPEDAGAIGDGVADDSAGVQAAINSGRMAVVSATVYKATAGLSVPAFVPVLMRGARIASTAAEPIAIAGTGAQLDGVSVSTGEVQQALDASSTAAGVTLRNLVLDTSVATSNGHAIQMNVAGLHDWSITGLVANARGYGLLVNTAAGGSDGLYVSGFRLSSVAQDAIEYNTPATALTNVVTWGGHLKVTGGSTPNAGFSLGIAHNHGFVAGGFISKQSRNEALHIEDGCRYGVVSSFVATECGRDGVRHLRGGFGANQAESKPLVFSAFSLKGVSPAPVGSIGFYPVWDASDVQDMSPVIGGVVDTFDIGVTVESSRKTFILDTLSFRGVRVVCRVSNGAFNQSPGRLFSTGANKFVETTGSTGRGATLGKFYQSDAPPDYIIHRVADTSAPGHIVRGFAYPMPDLVHPGGSTIALQNVCRTPTRMFGRLTILFDRAAATDGGFWEGDVTWDGTTLTTANVIVHQTSPISISGTPLEMSGGFLRVRYFAAATQTIRQSAEFNGTYYVA